MKTGFKPLMLAALALAGTGNTSPRTFAISDDAKKNQKSPEEREDEHSSRPLYKPPGPGRNQRKRRKHQRRSFAAGNKKAFA